MERKDSAQIEFKRQKEQEMVGNMAGKHLRSGGFAPSAGNCWIMRNGKSENAHLWKKRPFAATAECIAIKKKCVSVFAR